MIACQLILVDPISSFLYDIIKNFENYFVLWSPFELPSLSRERNAYFSMAPRLSFV